MCLSTVYLVEDGKDEVVLTEAVNVSNKNGIIKVNNLFGEFKEFTKCYIDEIDLNLNRIILKRL